jgi:hypothetical protein
MEEDDVPPLDFKRAMLSLRAGVPSEARRALKGSIASISLPATQLFAPSITKVTNSMPDTTWRDLWWDL